MSLTEFDEQMYAKNRNREGRKEYRDEVNIATAALKTAAVEHGMEKQFFDAVGDDEKMASLAQTLGIKWPEA